MERRERGKEEGEKETETRIQRVGKERRRERKINYTQFISVGGVATVNVVKAISTVLERANAYMCLCVLT